MNEVEFNGNQAITLDSICEFLMYKLIEANDINTILTNTEMKETIANISKIMGGSKDITSKQLLDIIKILLPYKVMEDFGGQVIHTHFEEDRQQHFKYELTNGDLYLYNNYLSRKHQRKIKVTKINGVNVSEILSRLDLDIDIYESQIAKILMHPELLAALGIDTTNGYNVTLVESNREINFSLSEIKHNMDFTIFIKNSEPAQILSKENFKPYETSITEEDYSKKLLYSFDSCQKLLQMLLGLSKSHQDIELFNEIMKSQLQYNIKSNSDKYLDWMFISTFLIFNDQKIGDLSDDEYEEILMYFVRGSNSYFLDENNQEVSKIGLENIQNIGNNSHLLKEDTTEIDYKELIKAIRNALAHSGYEVIDDNYIRCYGTNFNVKVDKKIVKKIMEYLINNITLYDLFPLFYVKEIQYNPSIENESELISYLRNISYISRDDATIKKDKIDNEFRSRILKFKQNNHSKSLIGTKAIIRMAYNSTSLGEYIDIPLAKDTEDKDIDIEYVLKEIRKFGTDFYKHSVVHQHHIIMEIIKQRESSTKVVSTKIFNIVNTEDKTTGNIIDTIAEVSPIEYVNYGQYVQETLISYLNSLLVFPCNDLFHRLDCTEMSLDSKMTIPLIKDKRNRDTSKERLKAGQNLQKEQKQTRKTRLEELKEFISDQDKKEEKLKIKRQELAGNKDPEKVRKIQQEIEEIENGTYEKKLNDEIAKLTEEINAIECNEQRIGAEKTINNKYHQIIIEHLRNALVHGRVTFPNGFDFNNIGDTIIHFEDYDENTKTFDGTIKISDLILELNDKTFLLSIFPPELVENRGRKYN